MIFILFCFIVFAGGCNVKLFVCLLTSVDWEFTERWRQYSRRLYEVLFLCYDIMISLYGRLSGSFLSLTLFIFICSLHYCQEELLGTLPFFTSRCLPFYNSNIPGNRVWNWECVSGSVGLLADCTEVVYLHLRDRLSPQCFCVRSETSWKHLHVCESAVYVLGTDLHLRAHVFVCFELWKTPAFLCESAVCLCCCFAQCLPD